MALSLTSKGVLKKAEAMASGPTMLSASTALSSSLLIGSMQPGTVKTLTSAGVIAGGVYLHMKGRRPLTRAIGTGVAAGALWSLVMRK